MYLLGDGARLENALVQYALDFVTERGWTPVSAPEIVRTYVQEGCGFQPRGESTQTYELSAHHSDGKGDWCLSATAEIPLAGLLMNKRLSEMDLPRSLVSFGRAYRTEAGTCVLCTRFPSVFTFVRRWTVVGRNLIVNTSASHSSSRVSLPCCCKGSAGKASRGLYRLHQFSKVEMFGVCEGNLHASEALLNEMVALQTEMYASLGLHFRVRKGDNACRLLCSTRRQ